MSSRSIEDDPIMKIDLLREKLRKAKEEGKLSQDQINQLKPASLRKRDQCNTSAYQVGSLRKQNEESKDETASKQGVQRQVPMGHVEKYMKQFADAKVQGSFSHLSEAMVKKLEVEVRVSASDFSKTAELEEFFRSIYSEDVNSSAQVVASDDFCVRRF